MRGVAVGFCTVVMVGALLVSTGPAAATVPTADSGPSVVTTVGTDAHLTGTAADADGDLLQIKWLHSTLNGGDFSTCTFNGPSSFEPITAAGLAPTLHCTQSGGYLMQLVVADGTNSYDSTGALVTFTVNHAPVVDSGPGATVAAGMNANLSGSASDPDGDPLEIRWLITVVSAGNVASCTFAGPLGFAPLSAAGLAPTLNCTQPGSYLVQLIAGDGQLADDDIGTLITFIAADSTPAECTVVPPSRLSSGYRVRVSDPESGISSFSARPIRNSIVSPPRGRFRAPVGHVDITVGRQWVFAPGSATIAHRNGAGISGSCQISVSFAGAITVGP